MFVTTIVGRVIPSANRIELASAGHCKPVMLRADGSAFEIETDGSLPLGILRKVSYRQGKIDLQAGDFFICYTDGLSESRNSTDEVFERKIISCLAGQKFETPKLIVDRLIDCEKTHRGARRQDDDLTLLVGGLA